MYDKITVNSKNINEICKHLDMNGYCFECIGQNIYVFNEETDYVRTILKERGYEYLLNDDIDVELNQDLI